MTESEEKYGDILNLPHHQSKVHPQMSIYDRAAQFSPFAALTGHEAAIKETARLTEEQVEQILDKYTVGKVAFTLKGYQAIVPDMTEEETAFVLEQLKLAREQAIDYKNMKQISAIFEIYKTKCEQYFNEHGRNWRQMFKDYVNKRNAEKKAQGKK